MSGLSLLVIEDEALLAMDIAFMAEGAGHRVVAEAASLAEVAALSEELAPDAALVDVQLLHGSSGVDAACLVRQMWPDVAILFVTANATKLPAHAEGAVGALPKPFTRATLVAALTYLRRLRDDPEAPPLPPAILPVRVGEAPR